MLFSLLSIAAVLTWHIYRKKRPLTTDQPALNRRGEQYVGRFFTLDHPIVNGRGKVVVDDTTWKVGGADLDAGSKVRVVAVDGVMFRVEKA